MGKWDSDEDNAQRYTIVRFHVTAGREINIFHTEKEAVDFSNDSGLTATITKVIEHMPKGWQPKT